MIQPIVEGHAEVEALPVLLRRLRDEIQAFAVEFLRPIRRKRSELVLEQPLRNAIRLALLKPECQAILIVFDGDDDCPAELAPIVEGWAQDEAGQTPCAVVIAHREYEAWFLATLPEPHPAPETVRDAKGELADRLEGRYLPTVDQPSLSATFDMSKAYPRCRSFRRLVKAFGELVQGLGIALPAWPPPAWVQAGQQ
jgi:uncharacterized protein DUF4276